MYKRQLCELMAKTDAPLGVLVDQLEDSFGKTSYGRRDLRLEAEDAETLRTLLPGVNPKSICGKVPQNVSHMDGLRLAFEDDTWLLVRPSGTEPVAVSYTHLDVYKRQIAWWATASRPVPLSLPVR